MAAKKPVKTLHYLNVAASLEAQNQAILMLLQTVSTALTIDGAKMSPAVRDGLEKQAEAARKAMWPEDDEN